MVVEQRTVDDKLRLEFKYKIKSGPTKVKSYGLALARCLRFPSSLLDRADELVEKVLDESCVNMAMPKKTFPERDETTDSINTTLVSQEMTVLEKDVLDLYSSVLILMSNDTNQEAIRINEEAVNQRLVNLIDKMSPEFQEIIKTSSLNNLISILNASSISNLSNI